MITKNLCWGLDFFPRPTPFSFTMNILIIYIELMENLLSFLIHIRCTKAKKLKSVKKGKHKVC